MRGSALGLVVILAGWLFPAHAQEVQGQAACATHCIYLPVMVAPPFPVTSDPASFVPVISQLTFRDASGAWQTIGEVENRTNAWVDSIIVTAQYYDAAGTLLTTAERETVLPGLAPGQRSPFVVVRTNAPLRIGSMQLVTSWQPALSSRYGMLTVVSNSVRDNSGVEIFGEVRNDQATRTYNAVIAVTFYDADGNVTAVDGTVPTHVVIDPGVTETYVVSTFDAYLTYSTYSIQAMGYFAP